MTIKTPRPDRRPAPWLALLLMLPALAVAAPEAPSKAAGTPQAQQGPVEVRADRATFDQKAGTGVYRGHAEMIQGQRHLYADVIHLYTKNNKLVRVEATGNPVHMIEGKQFDATAQNLVYNIGTHKLILTGNAHIKHDGSTFDGARVEYNLNTKRVDASGEGKKRVRLVIPANGEQKPGTGNTAKDSDKTPASGAAPTGHASNTHPASAGATSQPAEKH